MHRGVIGSTFPLNGSSRSKQPTTTELTTFSSEMLNAHRVNTLFNTHNVIQIPLPVHEHCLRGGILALSYVSNHSTSPTVSSVDTGSPPIPRISSCLCTSREHLSKHQILPAESSSRPDVHAIVDPITCKINTETSYIVRSYVSDALVSLTNQPCIGGCVARNFVVVGVIENPICRYHRSTPTS